MRKKIFKKYNMLAISITLVFLPFSAFAQAGVCNRQADVIGEGIWRDADARIRSVQRMALPPDEKNALILLHLRARDRAFGAVEQVRYDCTRRYIPIQKMANYAVRIYSMGLSEFLPPQYSYVDVSEIIDGRPLGGPNAVIPKARDDALRNLEIGGDVGKIIRDPKQALPWNW